MKRPNKAHNTKLNDAEVKEIRKLVKAGKTLLEVSLYFGMATSAISRIANRKTYGWVK